MRLFVKRLDKAAAVVPHYEYADDAGADLTVSADTTIEPGSWGDVPSDVAMEIPIGHWVLILGRSSTFVKRSLFVVPATIDGGFRGPLYAFAINLSDKPVTIRKGDRIAQVIVIRRVQPQIVEVETLSESDRGTKGFGSSGGHDGY